MVSIVGTPNGTGTGVGSIDPLGDVDSFNIVLRGGELYELQANRTSGTLDPTLTLRDLATGAVLGVNDDRAPGNLNSRILVQRTGNVNGRMDVAAFANASTGGYQVIANEVPGNVGTYSNLAIGTSRTGDLHANGDQDFHRMTLVAGRTYRFNLDGANFGNGALADPFLELRNSAGTIIRSDDDSGAGLNSQIAFTAASSGTFFANARGFNNAGTGGYRLSATQIA
jgi:hypothetical protein